MGQVTEGRAVGLDAVRAGLQAKFLRYGAGCGPRGGTICGAGCALSLIRGAGACSDFQPAQGFLLLYLTKPTVCLSRELHKREQQS